jgi:hypothetical protein
MPGQSAAPPMPGQEVNPLEVVVTHKPDNEQKEVKNIPDGFPPGYFTV